MAVFEEPIGSAALGVVDVNSNKTAATRKYVRRQSKSRLLPSAAAKLG
jgi:hypothetical protein